MSVRHGGWAGVMPETAGQGTEFYRKHVRVQTKSHFNNQQPYRRISAIVYISHILNRHSNLIKQHPMSNADSLTKSNH